MSVLADAGPLAPWLCLLGIGPTFAWELVRAGSIPSVKLGRRALVPSTALEHLASVPAPIAARERDGAAPARRDGDHGLFLSSSAG